MPPRKINRMLHRGWEFRQAGGGDWLPAQIPGEVHTDLLQNGVIEDPFYRDNESHIQWVGKTDWEYRCRFDVPGSVINHQHIEVVFEGLDTYADVYLNENLILRSDNMFREWQADVKHLLEPTGNRLLIRFRSPINEVLPKMANLPWHLPAVNDAGEKTSPYTRKAPYQFGWDWGPRFVTCGIWLPVYLQVWERARILAMHIIQQFITPETARLVAEIEIESPNEEEAVLHLSSEDGSFPKISNKMDLQKGRHIYSLPVEIPNPRLWWPAGYGDQPLYTFRVELEIQGRLLDVHHQKTGLRTIELRCQPDAWGESFEFIINGVPVFAKGGNWITADSFPARVSANRYRQLLESVKAVNMNMVRVWGGGIYEKDVFYEICNELGLLVWQDFMFACSMYPGDPEFLENIRQEAICQVRRLRRHPAIVLWCGNNEIEVMWKEFGWRESLQPSVWEDYREIFYRILPEVCAAVDGTRPYWSGSPASGWNESPNSQSSGDMHYWGVWHNAEPFTAYLKQTPRFMSEYGFQSFPEQQTIHRFTLPQDRDITSPVMQAHQKNRRGNQLIQTYLLQYYRPPCNFEAFLYISQILQAEGVKIAAEHLRRNRPRCMGSLYWQLNDCWPVASWSSIDYYGRWKALHYYARKFYAPVLVSAVAEEERINIFIISDLRQEVEAELSVKLMNLNGTVLRELQQDVTIAPLSSQMAVSVSESQWAEMQNRTAVFLHLVLKQRSEVLSSNTLFLAPDKELSLPPVHIETGIEAIGENFKILLKADKLAKNVYLTTSQQGFFSDNFFHLIPSDPTEVMFYPRKRISKEAFDRGLKIISLVEAF